MANGQGLQGALGGAATGFTMGGPAGAAIGGLAGGLLGHFGSSENERKDFTLPGFQDRQAGLNEAIAGAGQVAAPMMTAQALGQFQGGGMGGQFRQGQQDLIGQLQQQAQGGGPSLANQQFQQSLAQGVNAQQAMANTGRGNTALAGIQAAQNVGGLTQGLAGQAANARMQEQLAARQQLAGALQAARGQELSAGQFNAVQQNQRQQLLGQFGQEAALANQRAALQNQAQQNQFGLGLREQELRNAQLQQQGLTGFAGQNPQQNMGTQLLGAGGSALANRFGG